MTEHRIGTRESGLPHASSCSSARRSTPGAVTSSRSSDASCPGSPSRRSTSSTPTTARRGSTSSSRDGRSCSCTTSCSTTRPAARSIRRSTTPSTACSRTCTLVTRPSSSSRSAWRSCRAYKRPMAGAFWASSTRTDFNFDLGFSHTAEQGREAVAQMTGSGLPAIVEQNARATGTDVAGYRPRAQGSVRSYRRRHALSHVLDHLARARVRHYYILSTPVARSRSWCRRARSRR